jgi:hypothetical protein
MPNATVRANARALPKVAPKRAAAPFAVAQATDAMERLTEQVTDEAAVETEAGRDLFDRAYVRWLRARAALDDPDASYADEEGRARQNEVDEAARALLVTPVFCDDMLWRKWAVLEHFVSADAVDGQALDNRTVMALGCIKADLMRLGIGNDLDKGRADQ